MRLKPTILFCAFALCTTSASYADKGGDGQNNNGAVQNDNNRSFSSAVIGSTPGTTVGGVAAGGAPWVVGQGKVSLQGSGEIQVEVSGLVIGAGANVPANLVGTVGTVARVTASVVCGGSGGTIAATTPSVPLSGSGNASIEATVMLPASCIAPVVLVRVFNTTTSVSGPFIAVNGLTSTANNQNNHDDHSHDEYYD